MPMLKSKAKKAFTSKKTINEDEYKTYFVIDRYFNKMPEVVEFKAVKKDKTYKFRKPILTFMCKSAVPTDEFERRASESVNEAIEKFVKRSNDSILHMEKTISLEKEYQQFALNLKTS